jgi:hypothetical protein
LERWSHPSRAESGRATPDTAHTSLSEGLRFFHFGIVRVERPEERHDLMLSDRAGEAYREVRNRPNTVSELLEVKKAHRLVLLLDGGRVVNTVERAGAMQSVRRTLRVLLDGGGLGSSSVVQVVTTKVDLIAKVAEAAEKTRIDSLLEDFRERLRSDFGPRLDDLSFFDIAARDPDAQFSPAFGVDNLLRSWVESVSTLGTRRPREPLPLRSEFDRLLARTPGGEQA